MSNYITIEEAVDYSGKSIRTIQRHCDKDFAKGKKLDIHLNEPIFSFQKSEKGGRLKLYSREWLLKRFSPKQENKSKSNSNSTKKSTGISNKENIQQVSSSNLSLDYDLKDKIIDILESDKKMLVEDKKELQNIIKKLTESLQLEQRKVAQLESERMQLTETSKTTSEQNNSGGLSKMSMAEWWAKKQSVVIDEEENINEDADIKIDNPIIDDKELTLKTTDEKVSAFANWIKSVKK